MLPLVQTYFPDLPLRLSPAQLSPAQATPGPLSLNLDIPHLSPPVRLAPCPSAQRERARGHVAVPLGRAESDDVAPQLLAPKLGRAGPEPVRLWVGASEFGEAN